ncbi:MAG: hypothetical protein E5X60_25875 [Mesorhizobium sp.]|nr:MAG: hypothetical protein E5X60_25875 [Mesorhizobium sp.]
MIELLETDSGTIELAMNRNARHHPECVRQGKGRAMTGSNTRSQFGAPRERLACGFSERSRIIGVTGQPNAANDMEERA